MFSVLHILNKYDLSQGGPPRAVFNILKGLKKKGIKTQLISTSENHILKKNNLIYLGNNLIKRFSFPSISLIIYLKKKIKEYDVIHIHCMWNFITSISFYFAIFYKKKIIFSPHGTMDKNNIKKNFFLKKIFYYLVERNNIKYIDLVHFLSPDEKKNSKYLTDNKYFIANNGLDLNRFKINKQKKLKIFKNNKFNILNMGRYNKIKGLEIQLQLIKKINKFKDEFRIFFVGPNCKEKKKLIEKTEMLNLKKNVFFLPPIYSDKRFKMLYDCDLVINTSYYECNSMTILESLASGGLVLAVENANVNHQFQYNALIKTKRNLNDLSNGIRLLKKNKKKQLKIRKNAILYANRFLNINTLTNKYLKQYKSLIKS